MSDIQENKRYSSQTHEIIDHEEKISQKFLNIQNIRFAEPKQSEEQSLSNRKIQIDIQTRKNKLSRATSSKLFERISMFSPRDKLGMTDRSENIRYSMPQIFEQKIKPLSYDMHLYEQNHRKQVKEAEKIRQIAMKFKIRQKTQRQLLKKLKKQQSIGGNSNSSIAESPQKQEANVKNLQQKLQKCLNQITQLKKKNQIESQQRIRFQQIVVQQQQERDRSLKKLSLVQSQKINQISEFKQILLEKSEKIEKYERQEKEKVKEIIKLTEKLTTLQIQIHEYEELKNMKKDQDNLVAELKNKLEEEKINSNCNLLSKIDQAKKLAKELQKEKDKTTSLKLKLDQAEKLKKMLESEKQKLQKQIAEQSQAQKKLFEAAKEKSMIQQNLQKKIAQIEKIEIQNKQLKGQLQQLKISTNKDQLEALQTIDKVVLANRIFQQGLAKIEEDKKNIREEIKSFKTIIQQLTNISEKQQNQQNQLLEKLEKSRKEKQGLLEREALLLKERYSVEELNTLISRQIKAIKQKSAEFQIKVDQIQMKNKQLNNQKNKLIQNLSLFFQQFIRKISSLEKQTVSRLQSLEGILNNTIIQNLFLVAKTKNKAIQSITAQCLKMKNKIADIEQEAREEKQEKNKRELEYLEKIAERIHLYEELQKQLEESRDKQVESLVEIDTLNKKIENLDIKKGEMSIEIETAKKLQEKQLAMIENYKDKIQQLEKKQKELILQNQNLQMESSFSDTNSQNIFKNSISEQAFEEKIEQVSKTYLIPSNKQFFITLNAFILKLIRYPDTETLLTETDLLYQKISQFLKDIDVKMREKLESSKSKSEMSKQQEQQYIDEDRLSQMLEDKKSNEGRRDQLSPFKKIEFEEQIKKSEQPEQKSEPVSIQSMMTEMDKQKNLKKLEKNRKILAKISKKIR